MRYCVFCKSYVQLFGYMRNERTKRREQRNLIFKCMKRYQANCYNIVGTGVQLSNPKEKVFSLEHCIFKLHSYSLSNSWSLTFYEELVSKPRFPRNPWYTQYLYVCVSRYKMQLQEKLSPTFATKLCAHDSFMVRPNLCHNKIFSIIQNQLQSIWHFSDDAKDKEDFFF